jgi:flagellar biosynthesis/type III secretory pathway chaperone
MADTMISPDPLSDLLDELRQVLETERRALLGGRPEEISEVTRRKLDLAELIERESTAGLVPPAAEQALIALARYNRENSVICTVMLRHLADALDHLRQHELHHSYNPDGSVDRRSPRQPLGAA